MKGGRLKGFLSQGLAEQGNWSYESDGRRLGLAGLRDWVRNHRREKARPQGMWGWPYICVISFGVSATRTQALQGWGRCMAELPSPAMHLDLVFHHTISYCFLHRPPASFTAQSRCYSSASFSLFSVVALHPIYCSLFKPCSKDRIINFLMDCSSWALIITVLHK